MNTNTKVCELFFLYIEMSHFISNAIRTFLVFYTQNTFHL
jgi:hypothetical protein